MLFLQKSPIINNFIDSRTHFSQSGIYWSNLFIEFANPYVTKGDAGAVILKEDRAGPGLKETFGKMILRFLAFKQSGPLAVRRRIDDNINGLLAIEPESQPILVLPGRFEQNTHLVPFTRLLGEVVGGGWHCLSQ